MTRIQEDCGNAPVIIYEDGFYRVPDERELSKIPNMIPFLEELKLLCIKHDVDVHLESIRQGAIAYHQYSYNWYVTKIPDPHVDRWHPYFCGDGE